MVHRVGDTLLLDDFDIHKHLLRRQEHDWSWLRKFYFETIVQSMQRDLKVREWTHQLLQAPATSQGWSWPKFRTSTDSQRKSTIYVLIPMVGPHRRLRKIHNLKRLIFAKTNSWQDQLDLSSFTGQGCDQEEQATRSSAGQEHVFQVPVLQVQKLDSCSSLIPELFSGGFRRMNGSDLEQQRKK